VIGDAQTSSLVFYTRRSAVDDRAFQGQKTWVLLKKLSFLMFRILGFKVFR